MQTYEISTPSCNVAWDYVLAPGTRIDGFKVYYAGRVKTLGSEQQTSLSFNLGDTQVYVTAYNATSESPKSETILIRRVAGTEPVLNAPTNVRVV
jgi:hypothetical protein